MIGQRIGNYVITAPLQEGGMSTVYVAEHPEIGRRVAVKVVSAALSDQADAVDRFLAEARAISRLDHPSIITIYDFGRTERGQLYYVMELLRGRELAALMAERGPMRSHEVLPYVQQVCVALQVAHDHGIVHRDLKPENVFVLDREPLALKLLDFGIAKIQGRDGETNPNRTVAGMVMGTPFTIAPEQAAGRPDLISARTDLYSLGAVVYWMLAGHPPFASEATALVLAQHIRDPPPPLSRVAPHVGPVVAELVERCLAKTPAQRPASATELSVAFAAAVAADGAAGASGSALSSDAVLAQTMDETRVRRRSLPAAARRSAPPVLPPAEDSTPTDRGAPAGSESFDDSASSSAGGESVHDTDSHSWDALHASDSLPATRRAVRPEPIPRPRVSRWAWVGGAALVVLAGATLWVWSAAPARRPTTPANSGAAPSAGVAPAGGPLVPTPAASAIPQVSTDPAPSGRLRTVEITALDFEGRCRLRVEGGRSVEQPLPCQLQLSLGQEVELEVLRVGYAAFRRRWRVLRDERLVLRALAAAQRIVEVKAPGARAVEDATAADLDPLWPEVDVGLPAPGRAPSRRRSASDRAPRSPGAGGGTPRRSDSAGEGAPPLLGEDTAAF